MTPTPRLPSARTALASAAAALALAAATAPAHAQDKVSDGVVKPFDGDLDEYAAWLRSRPAGEQARAPAMPKAVEPPPVWLAQLPQNLLAQPPRWREAAAVTP